MRLYTFSYAEIGFFLNLKYTLIYAYIRFFSVDHDWKIYAYMRISESGQIKVKNFRQNFSLQVFSSSNHPLNGYPNFEAIWRRFTEIGHHELPTHNETNVIMIAERSDLLDLHYELDPHDDRSQWTKHLRLIFFYKNIPHMMCFQMHPGSPLKNVLNTELEAFAFLGSFSPYFTVLFFSLKNIFFRCHLHFHSLSRSSNSKQETQLASK